MMLASPGLLPVYGGHQLTDKEHNVGGSRRSQQLGVALMVIYAGTFPSGDSVASSKKWA